MRLHAENERVSKRFAQLEESLRNTEHNDQRYKVSVCVTVPRETAQLKCDFVLIFAGNSTANSQRVQVYDEQSTAPRKEATVCFAKGISL